MPRVTVTELAATLEQLQVQMAEISHRIQSLERENAGMHGPNGAASVALHPAAAPPLLSEPRTEPAPLAITEEELLAVCRSALERDQQATATKPEPSPERLPQLPGPPYRTPPELHPHRATLLPADPPIRPRNATPPSRERHRSPVRDRTHCPPTRKPAAHRSRQGTWETPPE